MNKGKYILVNGSFTPGDDYRISLDESNGYLFSERIRAIRTAFPFFTETLEIIKAKLRIFGQSFTDLTSNEGAGLRRQLERTLTKNKHFLGAVFTITFRFANQKMQYSIQSEKLENTSYQLNEKGLYIEAFDEILKPVSLLSGLSIGSEIYWNIAKSQLTNPLTDDFLILNTANQVVEIQESNIYLIKEKLVRGASSKQGAFQDISRPLMLNIFNQLGLKYSEDDGITIQDLKESEEMMSVNTIDGIRWIVGFEGKRFFSTTIRKINELFIQHVIS